MDVRRQFSEQNDLYAQHRPRYPRALFEAIAGLCFDRTSVWDAGTGSGQAAVGLAEFFDHVWATDVSQEQLDCAFQHPKVSYELMESEATNFAGVTFDLVTAAQSLHWFEHDRFWPEVQRVLKPNGVFAAWNYTWFSVAPELDQVLHDTVRVPIHDYWRSQVQLAWNGYRDLEFPFERLEIPKVVLEMNWNIEELFAYMGTWSATQNCIREVGDAFFRDAFTRSGELWGDPSSKRTVRMPLVTLVGRKVVS